MAWNAAVSGAIVRKPFEMGVLLERIAHALDEADTARTLAPC